MFKKYPFVKQTGIKDCGVSCLQMIIKYYQGFIGTRILQEMTKTTKNGTTAFHIIEAAKNIGFDAVGVKAHLSDIKNIVFPCIANVTIDNTYNHYVVIYEINYKKKVLLIADPANKVKRVSFEEFEKIWNNVLILLTPIKKIPLYTKEQKPIQFLLQIIKFQKKYIYQVIFISFFYSLFSIVGSYYFKFVIDGLTLGNTKGYLFLLFFVFLSVTILKLISDLFRNYLLVYLNEKIDMLLTNYIFKNIIFLPYNYYRNHTTGEIVSRMNDLGKIREMISKVILIIFIDLPLSIISFILLYFISSKLFFISIIILIVYLFVILVFIPIFDNCIKKVQSLKADYTSYMVESITGFETVKGIGIENNVINKFENKFVNYLNKIFKFETMYNKQHFIKESIYDIGLLVIILFGSFLIIENKMTIGSLIVFNSLFGYLIFPIRNSIENIIVFKEAKHSLNRILETINPSEENKKMNRKIIENIDIKNLNYSYNDRDLILKNINLKIKSKEKIMIIGNSGSGKSTLVKLIMQYYKVDRNKIIIDGIDINDYSNEFIKNNMIYISQNETLFTDTLYNNINLENIVDDEVFYNISKLCYVDQIIENNNLGYNMLVEENGFNLSGGEKQRIVLARALCRNFDILIIDEGLNQIDVDLERKILKNILNKYKDKTIIVISHRLENMDLFNRIIEFSNHKIKKDVCKCTI